MIGDSLTAADVAAWLNIPIHVVLHVLGPKLAYRISQRTTERGTEIQLFYFLRARIEHALDSGEIDELLDGPEVM